MDGGKHAVTVRRATVADAARLSALGEQTFRETFVEGFRVGYSEADLAAFVPETYAEAVFAGRIKDPAYALFVAERHGVPVGYCAVGPCGLPHPDVTPSCGELKQLYVARAAQGIGVGRALLDAGLAWLERDGPRRVWLGVWSGNDKAQAVYTARGFETAGGYGFRVGDTVDQEFIMRRG